MQFEQGRHETAQQVFGYRNCARLIPPYTLARQLTGQDITK